MSYEDFIASKRIYARPSGFAGQPDELDSRLFPFQREITAWALKLGRAATFAGTGLGKALPVDTEVLTPHGPLEIGQIQVGDEVIGADGRPTAALGVFPQGERDAYRVEFSDGVSTVCDAEHLWAVRTKREASSGRPWRTLTTAESKARGVAWGTAERQNRWFVPLVKPIDFAEGDLPLHPYVLGYLLGDGCLIGSRFAAGRELADSQGVRE